MGYQVIRRPGTAPVDRCAHIGLRRNFFGTFGEEAWKCEDCGRGMTVVTDLDTDEARRLLDGEES